MSTECYQFTVTTETSHTDSNPKTTDLKIPVRNVDRIEIEVPPGPLGTMGFCLNVGGVQCIPYNSGDYIVANDKTIEFQFEGLPQSGAWSVTTYNNGAYPHSIFIRFFVSPVSSKEKQTKLIDFEGGFQS